jgi:hypothetical protein
VSFEGTDTFEVDDAGQICEVRFYWDPVPFVSALSEAPDPRARAHPGACRIRDGTDQLACDEMDPGLARCGRVIGPPGARSGGTADCWCGRELVAVGHRNGPLLPKGELSGVTTPRDTAWF